MLVERLSGVLSLYRILGATRSYRSTVAGWDGLSSNLP
jgi:hypothetical protein